MMSKKDGRERLTWIIWQMIQKDSYQRQSLPRGLVLIWRPGQGSEPDTFTICRKGQYPSSKEDDVVLSCLRGAVRRFGRLPVDITMEPRQMKEGWGATVYTFRMAEQRPLL